MLKVEQFFIILQCVNVSIMFLIGIRIFKLNLKNAKKYINIALIGIVFILCEMFLITQIFESYILGQFIYNAELRSGEVVRAKNCETIDINKFCKIEKKEENADLFLSNDWIIFVVEDYWK